MLRSVLVSVAVLMFGGQAFGQQVFSVSRDANGSSVVTFVEDVDNTTGYVITDIVHNSSSTNIIRIRGGGVPIGFAVVKR